mgnify:CR=1 FL=1
MKQLTIAVPSYNSAAFISKGLDSYIYEDGTMDPRLEVIIVNDGSTDDTLKVARSYEERFPDGFTVIDKENGGHGSGINAGIDAARGRYYKVIDSDDWILTENLKDILDSLEASGADIVTTGFHTVNLASNVTLAYGAGDEKRELKMSEFVKIKDDILSAQMFHGLMYNTEFYRAAGIRMSEGVFFEDQEYAILPFMHAQTILLLPYFMYEYQTGNQSQSVNFENQGKKSDHLLIVLKNLIHYYNKIFENADGTAETEARRQYCSWRISNVVTSYYAAVLVKSSEREEGREKAAIFRGYLEDEAPDIAAATEDKYSKLTRMSRIPGVSAVYGKLFNSGLYKTFKKHWIK